VPAHIFLCVLAYYVEWHLRAWAPLFRRTRRRKRTQHSSRCRSRRRSKPGPTNWSGCSQ